MISSYLSYKLYTKDLDVSLNRQASKNEIAREAKYYQDHIGDVKSVDDFLKDQRLFNYAMTSSGLGDMTYAKAFMRKVLQSDRTDPNSFVNKLSDPRFLAFAKSYNFSTDGTVKQTDPAVQDQVQQDDMFDAYSQQRINRGTAAATEASYFKSKIATLTNVDDLVGNARLFSVALKAFGIDPSIASTSAIKSVLTSDLNDASSYANKLNDARYTALAKAFSFATDGSAPSGAQTALQTANTVFSYFENTGNGGTPAAADARTAYFKEAIANVHTVNDLVSDSTLLNVVVNGFGLDASIESPDRIKNVLMSDLSDPASYVFKLTDTKYQKLAAAFNFNTDGTLDAGTPAMDADAQTSMLKTYASTYDDTAVARAERSKSIYQIGIAGVTSVDTLLGNATLLNFVRDAFGFDATTSKATLRRALVADETDSSSFVNTTRDQRFKDLAAAFNFDSSGALATPPRAQLEAAKNSTMALYSKAVGDPTETKAATHDANVYYNQTMDGIHSVDDLLKDKKLVSYIMKAYGFEDGSIENEKMRQILTSDPLDKDSFVNQPENKKYRAMASAFNFKSDGAAGLSVPGQAQDHNKVIATVDAYVRQTMETQAGEENEAVRLSLYFQRNAPSITSPLQILADKAIFQVVRTTLKLPEAMSILDIDTQAKIISSKLDVTQLKDSAFVDKFINKFATIYDVANSDSTSTNAALSIIQQIRR